MSSVKTPDLRVGILSDVHIGFEGHINPYYYGIGSPGYQNNQEKWWEYSLKWFKNRGVDAIVVPGDMTNACDYTGHKWGMQCSRNEMLRLVELFREVFDGTDCELICVYGNHDIVQREETLNGGEATHWQDAFGEPYTRVVRKTVKGYAFVGAHWGYEAEAGPVLAEEAAAAAGKPVFYIQHGGIKDTTVGSTVKECSQNYDEGINNVRDWENVVAFSGHTHRVITDERAIWQSAAPGAPKCTSITCSTMNYGEVMSGMVNGENLETKHGLYMTVTGQDVNIERVSFWTDEMRALTDGKKTEQNFELCAASCGKDWHFTVGGEKVYDFEKRAAECVAPEFPAYSCAARFCGDTFAHVYFQAALPLERDDDLIHSYIVEAVDADGNVAGYGETCTEHHIDHDPARMGRSYQAVVFGLKPETEYTFNVYARDCYQLKSKNPITTKGKTQAPGYERLR